jgi:hypothetical protein
MRFRVRIPKAVKDKIASWGLSDPTRKRLYESIRDELGERPDDGFGPVGIFVSAEQGTSFAGQFGHAILE